MTDKQTDRFYFSSSPAMLGQLHVGSCRRGSSICNVCPMTVANFQSRLRYIHLGNSNRLHRSVPRIAKRSVQCLFNLILCFLILRCIVYSFLSGFISHNGTGTKDTDACSKERSNQRLQGRSVQHGCFLFEFDFNCRLIGIP